MECEEGIDYEGLYSLLSKVDKKNLKELVENYFDEIAGGLPEECTDAYTFLKNVSLSLTGMLSDAMADGEDINDFSAFVDQFDRFRTWYVMDSNIECISKKTGTKKNCTFFEALVMARTEKLDGEEYLYGFEEGMDFPLDEYIMPLGDVVAAETEEDEVGYIEEDISDPNYQYSRGLEE